MVSTCCFNTFHNRCSSVVNADISHILSSHGTFGNVIYTVTVWWSLYYIALAFQTLLERNGLNRMSSISIIILVFVLSLGVIGYFAVPIIANESQKLVTRWPDF